MAQYTACICFKKQKLVSIRDKSKHTSEEKIGKQINPNKKNKKNKHAQKVHLKTSCNKSLGKLKSRKILFDGKAVLLMVPWVRVDSDLFISLLSI
jgi:hypothetical protein